MRGRRDTCAGARRTSGGGADGGVWASGRWSHGDWAHYRRRGVAPWRWWCTATARAVCRQCRRAPEAGCRCRCRRALVWRDPQVGQGDAERGGRQRCRRATCARIAATATWRAVSGRSTLTYLDVALRARHRGKPAKAAECALGCGRRGEPSQPRHWRDHRARWRSAAWLPQCAVGTDAPCLLQARHAFFGRERFSSNCLKDS